MHFDKLKENVKETTLIIAFLTSGEVRIEIDPSIIESLLKFESAKQW